MQATAQIAWGAIGRRAIRLDPKWRGGDYYDASPGDGPQEGLSVARMVAQVTLRSDNVFTQLRPRARRRWRSALSWTCGGDRGRALPGSSRGQAVRRFDTNSYLVIGKAMDLHDVGVGPWRVGQRPAPGHRSDPWPSGSGATCCTPPINSARSSICSGRPDGLRSTPRSTLARPRCVLINLDQVGDKLALLLDGVSDHG
ncbi:MAG: hypothetical protein R2705_17955 [Ilumatobacteraceae bacterium]